MAGLFNRRAPLPFQVREPGDTWNKAMNRLAMNQAPRTESSRAAPALNSRIEECFLRNIKIDTFFKGIEQIWKD